MEATDQNPFSLTSDTRIQPLGSDRFYTLVRWLVLIFLFAVTQLLTDEPIWPLLQAPDPMLLVVWCYAGVTALLTVLLLWRSLSYVRNIAFVVDIAVVVLLTVIDPANAGLFYPLYLLPLIGVAMQLSPVASLSMACVTALLYIGASLGILTDLGQINNLPSMLEWLSLILRAVTIVFIPWLANGLAERSGMLNRQSVVVAEKETERAWDEANSYRDRMRALYEVAYTLSTTMNYKSVLNAALVESRKLVPYTSALVLLSTGEPDELYVAASYGLNPADLDIRVQIGQGRIAKILRSGDPSLIENIGHEAEVRPITALQQCKSSCVVPLRAALNTYGVLILASDRADAFTDEQLGMVTPLANYAIIALHNAQLVHDLREERAKLISKEEEVRHQLARDMHDGPAQALAAITMNIEFIKRLLERDPDRVGDELDKMAILSKRTTHEIRTLLFELRPLVLETQGLDVTLQQYFERFDSKETKIVLETEPVPVELDSKVEGTLFNIIQEAVNNALKHARAKHIWVRLKIAVETLEITIQDDGCGFDLKKVKSSYEQRGSFGLLNVEERAKLIGGMSEIHSAPGQGTTVRVMMPFQTQ
ncbi:MAG: GAF domain-containing sensor histidine kinase [Chloroflexota bacterium]